MLEETIETNIPRILVVTDFLPKKDSEIIKKYCRDNKDNFPFVGYDSPIRWKVEEHSKHPDFKYVKSFLISEEKYELYVNGKIPEPYPDDSKHGDNYNISMKVFDERDRHQKSPEDKDASLIHYEKWPNDFLQSATFDALTKYLNGVVKIVKNIYNVDCFSESDPWIAVAKEGGYMNMHCDGTFIHNRDAVTHFSSVYYINDDYEGGEFNMPLMGFRLKPKENSLLIFTHSSHEDMAHEVTPVISGDRFVSQGFFAIKKT
jgi:hypothetical protein